MSIEMIKSSDEESVEFSINGKHLTTVNHDEDGWVAMKKIENVIRKIAKEYGIDVQEIERDD